MRNKINLITVLILTLAGLLIYAPTFQSDFQFDDHLLIVTNPAVKNLTYLPALWTAFNTRFLTGLTFALNYAVGGLDVTGYHVVNTIIHIFNAFLVFVFIRILYETPYYQRRDSTLGYWLGLAAALIFLVHPVQTQGVTYITQRAVSLATLFYLASLILYVRARISGRIFYAAAALAATVLGMFTKEMTITIPVMLLVIEGFFLRPKGEAFRIPKTLIPFFLTLWIIPLTLAFDKTYSVLSLKSQVNDAAFQLQHLFTEINVLRTYLRLFVFPIHQNLDYDYPLATGLFGETLFSLALLILLAAVGVGQFSKHRMISFCILWFFITTSVEFTACTLIAQDMLYEHYLYLPMVGFAILAGWALLQWLNRGRVFVLVLVAVVMVFGGMSYARNQVWQDAFTLWGDAAKKSPRLVRPLVNLGVAYRRAGQLDQAIEQYQKALALDPQDDAVRAQIYTNMATVFGYKKDHQKEIEYCHRAITLDPFNVQAYSNLGSAYILTGDLQKALHYGQRAVALNPNFAEGWHNLGVTYARLGQYERAVELFERTLMLDPDHPLARQEWKSARDPRKNTYPN